LTAAHQLAQKEAIEIEQALRKKYQIWERVQAFRKREVRSD
jgi:hypothetical protein